MSSKKLLFAALAVLFGIGLGAFVKYAYWELNFFPMTNLFVSIGTSPVGLFVVKNTSSKVAVFLAIAMKAFPWSIVAGLVAGVALHKIKYQRLFCYSALLLPLLNFGFAYYFLSTISASHPAYAALWERFSEHLQVNLAVYSWYFLALYVSFHAMKHVVHNPRINTEAPPSGGAAAS